MLFGFLQSLGFHVAVFNTDESSSQEVETFLIAGFKEFRFLSHVCYAF